MKEEKNKNKQYLSGSLGELIVLFAIDLIHSVMGSIHDIHIQ